VLRSDAPRLNNVNFALRVGAVVPVSVHAIAVTPELIAIRPAFRDHFFFVVRDEIVILDHGHQVVAIIPVGDQVGSNEGPPARVGAAQDFSDLSAEEIRIIQQALIAQGFAIEVDGVFGPGTREALISFQRRHGLLANGRIDSRTIVALNVNIRGSGQAGGSATTGQGSSGAQQPAANPNLNQQGQSGSQPSATPQAGSNTQQRGSGNAGAGAGQGSSTTGQGSSPQSSGATSGQAPANNPPSSSTQGSSAAPSSGATPSSPGSSQGGK
jgi:peptidoglycan hydrolase-like protein with peptidoglycan-binding domain